MHRQGNCSAVHAKCHLQQLSSKNSPDQQLHTHTFAEPCFTWQATQTAFSSRTYTPQLRKCSRRTPTLIDIWASFKCSSRRALGPRVFCCCHFHPEVSIIPPVNYTRTSFWPLLFFILRQKIDCFFYSRTLLDVQTHYSVTWSYLSSYSNTHTHIHTGQCTWTQDYISLLKTFWTSAWTILNQLPQTQTHI